MTNESHDEPLAPPGECATEPAPPTVESDDTTVLFAELDALLERMLALPVNSLDGETVGDNRPILGEDIAVITIAEASQDSSQPYTTPAPPVEVSQDLYLQEVLAERERPEPLTPPLDPALLAEAQRPEPARITPNDPHHRLFDEDAPPVLASPLIHKPTVETRTVVPPPAWQQPLLWTNQAFERCTRPLGRFGDWLRGEKGRAVLGWAGVLLIAAVAGFAAWDWFAWPR